MSPPPDRGSQRRRPAGDSARERRARIEAAKAAERRHARRGRLLLVTAVGIVLVLIAVGVAFAIAQHAQHVADRQAQVDARDRAFISTVTSLPVATFDAVGVGSADTTLVPSRIPGGVPMTIGRKPRVLYIGAEYCPFCAMERWPLVAALSRFGTFTGLAGQVSTDNDTPADIPTLTFLRATFTSRYLSLTTYEERDRDRRPLQQVSAAEDAIFARLSPAQGIPFIDFGGLAVQNQPSYDGGFLSGESSTQVAADLQNPSSRTARVIIGSANVTTAQLCVLTHQQPGNVCSSTGVRAAAAYVK